MIKFLFACANYFFERDIHFIFVRRSISLAAFFQRER